MRNRRRRLGLVAAVVSAAVVAGCGGEPSAGPTEPGGRPGVWFVGFDGSPPLVAALREGAIQGLVLQNPLRMGRLGVETLVQHLEGRQVEAVISTGETLVTPENMDDPEIQALLNPPKVEHTRDTTLTGTKTKTWRIMVIPKGTTHEFWKTIHAGASEAAQAHGGVEIIWQGPTKEDDRTEQIKLVQNAVAAKVDGIVLASLDAEALVRPVEQAVDAGIPVVIIDSGLNSNKPVSYVATNNYNGGVLAARRLGELLGGQGKLILLRYAVGSKSTEEREQGFTDTIAKEFPSLVYLSDDQYAGATSDQAQRVAQTLTTKFRGQVDGIFCPNESSTLGMLRALKDAGMLRSR